MKYLCRKCGKALSEKEVVMVSLAGWENSYYLVPFCDEHAPEAQELE